MESAKLLQAIIETAIDGIITIDDRENRKPESFCIKNIWLQRTRINREKYLSLNAGTRQEPA
jgi:hypothetical protein